MYRQHSHKMSKGQEMALLAEKSRKTFAQSYSARVTKEIEDSLIILENMIKDYAERGKNSLYLENGLSRLSNEVFSREGKAALKDWCKANGFKFSNFLWCITISW